MQFLWWCCVYLVQGFGLFLLLFGIVLDLYIWVVEMVLWKQLLVLVELQCWLEVVVFIQEKGEVFLWWGLVQVQWSCCGYFLEVVWELGSGDILQVQFGVSLQYGFLVLSFQFWIVVFGFSFCLEYVEWFGDCFLGYVYQVLWDCYCDVDEYICVWELFCVLELVIGVVVENDVVIFQYLSVFWDVLWMLQGQLQGVFCLEVVFFEENCVDINFGCCYFCIWFEGLLVFMVSLCFGFSSFGFGLSVDFGIYIWVVYGQMEDLDQECWVDWQEVFRQVYFFIYYMGMEKVLEEVLRLGILFIVELLFKQFFDFCKEEVVCGLEEVFLLVISIVLGWFVLQFFCRVIFSRFLEWQIYDIFGGCYKLNFSQNRVVREVLEKFFIVIQGLLGIGKMIVGFYIIFWFYKLNQEQVQFGGFFYGEMQLGGFCILYCGFFNKLVDVLVELFLRRMELKFFWVYSEQVEVSEFLVLCLGSRKLFRRNFWEGRLNQSFRSIILYYWIWQVFNLYLLEIKVFDIWLQSGEFFFREDLVLYKKVLWEVWKFELDWYEVIFCICFCVVFVSFKILDVRQIFVDEVGMVIEFEIFIFLVWFLQVEKVVFFGDYKQLWFVVKNEWL